MQQRVEVRLVSCPSFYIISNLNFPLIHNRLLKSASNYHQSPFELICLPNAASRIRYIFTLFKSHNSKIWKIEC